MTTGLVLVAAGEGRRLGDAAPGPKALVTVRGATLLEHSLRRLAPVVDLVVVVHPPDHRDEFAAAIVSLAPDATLVPGGDSRTDSVRAGLDATPQDLALVAVHDAARPLAPARLLTDAVQAVGGRTLAAAPGLPVADTLKRVGDEGRVVATVERHRLWGVQTPQVFPRDVLRTTLEWAGARGATDELGLVEQSIAAGVLTGEVRLIPGSRWAAKVTYPEDLALVVALLDAGDPGAGSAAR